MPSSRETLLSYAQLFRLPNVFTAVADVAMGFLFTQPTGEEKWGLFALLVAASSLLYVAGMVLNDVYDLTVDARERPTRPLPSGRIDAGWAKRLAYGLLVAGVACGAVVSGLDRDARPLVVAFALADAVVLYDGALKATRLGPIAMGACRGLNVLLGMSVSPQSWGAVNGLVAAGIAIYIVGVTWFARREAQTSARQHLILATLVILAGPAMLFSIPQLLAEDQLLEPIRSQPDRWYWMWGMLLALIGWRCVRAIARPSPAFVQSAVRNCIFAIIVLDAAILVSVRSVGWSLAILALLLPTLFLGRWIYST